MKLKREDNVMVLSGKDKGKSGKITAVLPKSMAVVVDGVAVVKRHTKPTQTKPRGGIVEKSLPLPVSKVALVCPNCKKITRVGYQIKGKEKQRICKKCNKVIA